jgi:acyl carrier protein
MQQVLCIVAEKTGRSVENIKPGDRFADELAVDSLDTYEIIVAIEENFKLSIPAEKADIMQCPGAIADWLCIHLH